MDETVQILVAIGCLFLAGVAVDVFGRRTSIPRVTLLMILGILVSHHGLDLLPATATGWFQPIAAIALVMVGFLLGEKLTLENLRTYGREIIAVSIGASLGTSLVVGVVLIVFGIPYPLALLLAGIAAATDPAATIDVIAESGVDNEFTEKLQGIVALDDAWGLIVFSLCAVLALYTTGNGGLIEVVVTAGVELGGAVILGIAIGVPAAFLSGRLEPGQPTLLEALGIVFICGGLSLWFEVSFLISAMVLGATVANLATHHETAFSEIEGIEGPFLILFFILAGASLDLASLSLVGVLLALFVAGRFVGKLAGSWLGATLAGAPRETRQWMGYTLTPQAGVAVGMALIAIDRFPEYREVLLPTVVASTVFFELVGPLLTRFALRRVSVREV